MRFTMRKQIAFHLVELSLSLTMLCGCTSPPMELQPTLSGMEESLPSEMETIPVIEQSMIVISPPKEVEKEKIVMVGDYIPEIQQELRYATVNNFTGQRIYDFTDAYLRYGTILKLKEANEKLNAQGLGIKIWDAYRPVSAQAKLFDVHPDPNVVSHPVTGYRAHCRGNAVDVTLIELSSGEELPMPTGFDNFTSYADRDYSDCGTIPAANAQLLERVMSECGFRPLQSEWWHFTDTDTYPVDEYFDPETPTAWIANCNEYISLRKTAGGSDVIAKIPAGEVMTLHSWNGRYAQVSYGELIGYVLSSYIKPEDQSYFSKELSVVDLNYQYTYEQMQADLKQLIQAYPLSLSVSTAGISELGRDIPVLRIGSENARYHVLLQGAIHGREHATAWLLMALADYWLAHGIQSYGDVCYHIIPMINPDGVTISQTGIFTEQQESIYQRDKEQGYTNLSKAEYAAVWKANGLGTDLNRNFPAGWESITARNEASSEKYRGTSPFSTAETQCLRDYTLKYAFDVTISYHASGSLIYYEYGNNKAVNEESHNLAEAVCMVTGYPLTGSSGVDGAGFKDWVIDSLGIPSLTIEVGCQDAPLAQRELYSIFIRNRSVLPEVARWLQR